jgi:hypothetical protein
MSDERQSGPSMMQDMRTAEWLVMWTILALSSMIEVPLRRIGTVGPRYFGGRPLVGMILMFFFAGFSGIRDPNLHTIFWYWLFLVAMCGIHRWVSYYRIWRKKVPLNRYYVGESIFARWLPFLSHNQARALDVLVGFGLGGLFLWLECLTLAAWMPMAGVASLVLNGVLVYREQARDDSMRDAMIEQEVWADRARRVDPRQNSREHSDTVYRPKFVKSKVTSQQEPR